MNTAVLESITDAQKEQIFDPLFKEVHDKTIIGYLVTLIREEGGPVHETILFNKTVQNFSNLRKLSGGSYTGEPVSAARAALASAEIFKKDSRN